MAKFGVDQMNRRLFYVILGIWMCAGNSQAELYTKPVEPIRSYQNEFTFEPKFHFYSNTSNYGADGIPETPTGFDNFNRLGLDLGLRYGITDDFTAKANLSWVRNGVSSTTNDGESYGFGDQSFSLDYHFFKREDPFGLSFKFQVDFALYSNSTITNSSPPLLGDGSTDLSFVSFVSVPIVNDIETYLGITAGAGYTWRSSGFSSAIPYLVRVEVEKVADGPLASVGVFGNTSIKTDNTSNSQIGSGAGGSAFVNGVNPSHLTFLLTGGYRFSPSIAVCGAFTRSIWGARSPRGLGISAAVEYRFGGDPDRGKPAKKRRLKYDASNRGFVAYENIKNEARVTQVNDRLNLVKLDQGYDRGIEAGQIFDIFAVKRDGSIAEAVARGRIKSVKKNEAVLEVMEYFKEVYIEKVTSLRSLFSSLAGILILGVSAAQAERFSNQFIEFEKPPKWLCTLEGAEWVCQSSDPKKKRDAIIIMAAKLKGDQDSLDQYLNYLKTSKAYSSVKGKPVKSEVKYAKQDNINNHPWVDSIHLESEIPGFYTRYLATIKSDIAVLVTYSINKTKWSQYNKDFEALVKTLRVFRRPGALNMARDSKASLFDIPKSITSGALLGGDDEFGDAPQTAQQPKKKSSSDDEDLLFLIIAVAGVVGFIIWRRKQQKV